MNIKVQCCGIVLIVVLTIICERQRRLELISNRVFRGCFYAALFCLSMDIFSIVAIMTRDVLPLGLAEFVCKTYLVSIVLVALMAVIYVATSIIFHLPAYRNNIVASIVFSAIVAGLIYILPIDMHENAAENLAWSDGASTYATYFGVLILIIINVVQSLKFKEYIYERQRKTVMIWMILWVVAACVQMLNKQLLIVGFACALGVMVVFFQFENPELNLDWKTGLFNYVAYTRYGEQLYSGDKKFYVIAVMFENTAWQEEQELFGSDEVQKVFDIFLNVPDASAFKITDNEVLMILSREERAKAVCDSCVKWTEGGSAQERPSFYYVEDPKCVSSYRELLNLLQYASLQKKDAMRGTAHLIDESIASLMFSERRMTQQILEAVEEDRIIVYYQPIYSIEKKCFTSAEALVRIMDREGNIISPGEFVHIAENNGMINEIGKKVFEKVCNFFQQSKLEDLGMQYIEVNLSVVQCADDRLADIFIDIMNNSKMDPAHINLEITESASLHAKHVLISNMERMIESGMHFSIDDFGTGQSNLNYIVDMPVKIVKFDREMIQAYFTSEKARYVMDAAMHMIHGMGLKIVAEGIETEEQYNKMEEIKIDYIQGFYFSKPLPEQEFLGFLRQKNKRA